MIRLLLAAAIVLGTAFYANARPEDQIAAAFRCAERHIPKTIWVGPNQIELLPADIEVLVTPFVGAYGLMGWHTTWYVLFDLGHDRIIAYETLDPQQSPNFGRVEVPTKLRTALSVCGIDWHGLWTKDWPKSVPAHDPEPDLDAPASDLLPLPRQ